MKFQSYRCANVASILKYNISSLILSPVERSWLKEEGLL